MPEYAYDKKYKIWYCVQNTPFIRNFHTYEITGIDKNKLLPESKVEELRNARKNKKYLIIDNKERLCMIDGEKYYRRLRYPGINSDYIYEDLSDLKLIICDGTRYLMMYSYPAGSSLARLPIDYFINNEIVDPNKQDLDVVVSYVEGSARADARDPEHYSLSNEEKMAYILKRAKLYYSDLDEDAKLVYNCLGSYNLED